MFKSGDKVEVKGYTEELDGKGVVKEIFRGDIMVEFDRPFHRKLCGFPPKYVHKIDSQSPIRTVTRREIVPGTYGCVEVDVHSYGMNVVADFSGGRCTSEELREAAHIFNQLAEALEDKP